MLTKITKRSGEVVDFNPEKLNMWASWASAVDWSSIVLSAVRRCTDGCSSTDLHKAMIDACLDEETIPHLKMAGRLFIGDVYKEAFGGCHNIPTVKEQVSKMVELGFMEQLDYTDAEYEQLQSVINHSRDLEATYTELFQIRSKYSIVNRLTNQCHESPQFVYMRMAMANMRNMPVERRIDDITKLYTYLSKKQINAPTPFMVNLGTKLKGYASCCVFATEDTMHSIAAGNHISEVMTANSAGIGGFIKCRSKGDGVRGGVVKHGGKLPYYKASEAAVHANKQQSRGGASTLHFNCLDPEIMDLLALKNPTTVDQKRIKDIDYSFGYNEFFARKVARNEDWMLVSYADAPELIEALYQGENSVFEAAYNAYAESGKPRTVVNARDIAVKALTEAVETGRIYLHRTDEMNRHTPFKDKIYSSNLCQEIALPTKGYAGVKDLYTPTEGGEIGLCSLASIVCGRVSEKEYESVAYYTLLMIDNVLDIMEYPFPNLEYTAKNRRSVGVGLTNLAFDMANSGFSYRSTHGKRYMHTVAERHSYYLHKASLLLAKERGVAGWIGKTKYPDGWLPIDTYNKNVDDMVGNSELRYDWEALREQIVAQGGIRHSVLEAFMPVESSSLSTYTTNSIYPVRTLKVLKTNGNSKTLFIAPDADTLSQQYESAWDIPTQDMIDMYSIFQKFCGQGISADLYLKYDGDNRKVSTKKLLTDFLYMTKMGLKSRYYLNSGAGVKFNTEEVEDKGCSGGGCTL